MECLKTCANAHDLHVLFGDEADLDINPLVEHSWGPKGEQRRIGAAGQNRRRTIFGAANYATHKVSHVVRERRRTADFVAFLIALSAEYPEGLVKLILDNCKIHDTKAVRTWLSENPRIELVFLPTYSPNLNLIEPFWRWLKRQVASNRLRGQQRAILAHEDARQRALGRLIEAASTRIADHNAAVAGNGESRQFRFAS